MKTQTTFFIYLTAIIALFSGACWLIINRTPLSVEPTTPPPPVLITYDTHFSLDSYVDGWVITYSPTGEKFICVRAYNGGVALVPLKKELP